MKVKDLIAVLQTYDPELMVVRSGYEGGVDEIMGHDKETIALNVNAEWYYGPHEVVVDEDQDEPEYEGHKRIQAVYLR
jgi:hypothetical protein